MPRKSGDDIRIVIGPKKPKIYEVRADRLRQVTLVLRPKKAFSDAFCERLRKGTALYVTCASSYELAPKGRMVALLDKWCDSSRPVRNQIWRPQTGTTAESQSRITLAAIQKRYFRRQAQLYAPLQGHKRQLMASAALGLDTALMLCQYVVQELKSNRRGNHVRELWDVWLAMIIAELRAAGCNPVRKLKPRMVVAPKFGDLIRALEDTLPDTALKRQYAPVVFRQHLKRAAMLARGQTPEILAELMKFWGNYDRAQSSKNKSLNKLLKRARRLYPLRPLGRKRVEPVAASPAPQSV